MINILKFLLIVIFLAFVVTSLSTIDNRIEAEAFGLKYSLHTGFIIGAVASGLVILVLFTSVIKDIMALPAQLRARKKEARQERGMAALARGMESVMVGDAVDAQHHARIARRNLEQSSLTRLLTAQAAQLAGDDDAARDNFTLMLEAPETEFLGLHGLYTHADRSGDVDAARRHAERAFQLRPNARWAYQSVLDLSLDRGAWGETRNVIRIAKDNRLITEEESRRAEAALLTADAYTAGASQDHETALKESEAAFRLCPDLTPAAILAASALADKGKKGRAAKLLEQSFAVAPHPAITTLYEKIYAEDKPEKKASAMKKLAALAADSHEAKFLLARHEALLENWDEAVEQLQPLIVEQPMAREFSAMAQAIGALRGEDAARAWLERAAKAPRNPAPGANGVFNFTTAGWGRLVREFMDNARLAPPPLEENMELISQEEVKMLAAPAPMVEENDEPSIEEMSTDEKSSDEKLLESTESSDLETDALEVSEEKVAVKA